MTALETVVPAGAEPGVSQIPFDLDESKQLFVVVPTEASPGDRLKLTPTSDGRWSVSILRRVQNDDGSAGMRKKITCLVPPDVQPGQKLAINTGDGGKVLIAVPPNAETADTLVLHQEGNTWKCMLVKRKPKERKTDQLQDVVNLAPPRAQPMDDDIAYERLAAAIRDAGGFISEKMSRGAVPPLFIPGMVATQSIAVGERLCKIPRTLHISPSIIKEVSPRLSSAILECEHIPPMRALEALQTAFMSQVLLNADARAVAERSNGEPPEQGYMPEVSNHVTPSVKRVWEAYGDNLLSQDFAYHPYRKAAADPAAIRKNMLPSPEVDFFIDMASDIISVHSLVHQFVPKELLGPRFEEVSMFLRGRLSVLTRVFQTGDNSTMVPVADLFNHMAGDPGSSWLWVPEEDALIITSNRSYEPGEEICDSYGPRSNVLLYRTWGFTQAPDVEPSWNFGIRPELAASIYEVFLPESERNCQIVLDGKMMEDSLEDALNAVAKYGQNAGEMLRMVCVKSKTAYDEDQELRPALEALSRARDVDPTRHNWWQYLDETSRGIEDDDGIRIKMSEYLCLTAHLEALAVYDGKRAASKCFARSSHLTRVLKDALVALRENGVFVTVAVPPSDPRWQGPPP